MVEFIVHKRGSSQAGANTLVSYSDHPGTKKGRGNRSMGGVLGADWATLWDQLYRVSSGL